MSVAHLVWDWFITGCLVALAIMQWQMGRRWRTALEGQKALTKSYEDIAKRWCTIANFAIKRPFTCLACRWKELGGVGESLTLEHTCADKVCCDFCKSRRSLMSKQPVIDELCATEIIAALRPVINSAGDTITNYEAVMIVSDIMMTKVRDYIVLTRQKSPVAVSDDNE
jgi:hypothetical protein